MARLLLAIMALFTSVCFAACSEKLLTPVIVVKDTSGRPNPHDTTSHGSTDTATPTDPDPQSTETDTSSAPFDTTSDFDSDTNRVPSSDSDSETDSGTSVVSGSDSDTETDSDSDSFRPIDSDTSSDTGTSEPIDTDTNTVDTEDTQTATDIDTATDTGTSFDTGTTNDTDSLETDDTDTYNYVYEPEISHVGFATVPALDVTEFGFNPADATVVEAASIEEINSAISARDGTPMIIYISGTLVSEQGAQIAIENQRDLQLVGRITTSLQGIGINVRNSANILIQNLSIHHVTGENGDCISIENSHHVWIDHCDVYNDRSGSVAYDGLVDITNGSDYITVSWNHFHEHLKGLIAGHSDGNADEDAGKFHITYHHNIFSNISPGSISVRFGQVHVFNNLFRYDFSDSTIGVSSRMNACVRAELNRFRGVEEPLKTDQSGDTPEKLGLIEAIKNVDDNGNVAPVLPKCQLDVPYEYTHTVTDTTFLEALLYQNVGIDRLR